MRARWLLALLLGVVLLGSQIAAALAGVESGDPGKSQGDVHEDLHSHNH